MNFVSARHPRSSVVVGTCTADALQALPTDLVDGTATNQERAESVAPSPIPALAIDRQLPLNYDAIASDPGPQIGLFHLLWLFSVGLTAMLVSSAFHWITQKPRATAGRPRDY